MSVLKKISFSLVILAMLVVQSAALVSPAYAATSSVRVYAKEVHEDKSVTVAGVNLAVNTRYSVYLSKYGRYPATAILVGSVTTDSKGSFTKTFRIPGKLVDVAKISINITSNKGGTASNWFINATSDSNTGGEGAPTLKLTLVSVKEDDSVKIKVNNLPANVTFDVRMGKSGSKGVNGTRVGTLASSSGGSVKATFDIPDNLVGKSKIDLRVENKGLGISASLTFDNK
jgi:hypothetical protein